MNLEAAKISRCPLTPERRGGGWVGLEATRGRVGEDTGLKTGGWSPLADGWGCVHDYIRRPCFSASHPRRGPLNNASHSSIRLLGLRFSTYDHSASLFLASGHLIRPAPPPFSASTASRVLITTVALIWVGDSREEERAAATTWPSKRNENICVCVCVCMYYFKGIKRAIENDYISCISRKIMKIADII